MTLTIREAAPEDEALILPLLRDLHAFHAAARPDILRPADEAALLADLRALREQERATALLAEEDGAVLGYVLFSVEARPERPLYHAQHWGVLHHIAVVPGRRREGIGRALIAALRDRLRARGVARMRTGYWAFNAASAALMRQAGFVPYHIHAEAEVG